MAICECIANDRHKWTPEMLVGMGFTQKDDGSGSPWGTHWEMSTDDFELSVDPCGVVKLARRNPDSDHIVLHVCERAALEAAINFIQD